MIKVRELTLEQKNLLIGKQWGAQGQYFDPQLDTDGKWFTSNETVVGCTLIQALEIGCESWLTNLPEIDYNPILKELPQ
jgi:hypothetical protein